MRVFPALFLVLAFVPAAGAQPAAPAVASDQAAPPSYVPERVFDSHAKRFTDFESMLADLMYADVVFVGEQHDDPGTHRLELAVLDGLARRRGNVILALEMFERDVQPALDAYLAGTTTEAEFLKTSRPWPRYQTDYRPLIEFAKARHWTVVASNVPRTLAADVSRSGLAALDQLPADQRGWAAHDLQCPFDDYFKRFAEAMNAHPMPGSEKQSVEEKRQMTERFYFAQCVKDETMGESVANAIRNASASRPLVVHVDGAFHSDYGMGTAARAERRLKGAAVKVVTMLPVADLDRLKPTKDDRKMADYLVYTIQPPKAAAAAGGAR
jgi:uncharacterized iron-regulated protein